ncbi:hypothetical protein HLB23_19070 [Nocardia uniformis]|uniref:Uncharacterized protein n=1 Tax=Nocardia uniformis TaxID=53432 RepID=A0A849BZF6_9NOCA|nr:hypothetical protein [Nocardia uniformis]NNH71933.1 hypothetical protein [Nocardia uniformis]
MVRSARKPLFAVYLSLTAVVLAACGSVHGTPVAGEIDVRELEVGAYSTDKYRYDQDAGNSGALLEGFRMSEAVAPTVAIDPALVYGRGGRATTDAADATETALAAVSEPVLERNNLLAAFAASGSDRADLSGREDAPDSTTVTNMVLRFADEQTAATAAQELEDADFDVAPELNRKLSLSQYPDAHIHWRPGIATVGAFMAYRDFVISLFIERPEAVEQDLLDWVRKALDAQVPVLDKFEPTAQSQFSSLEVDPDGLLARVTVKDRSGMEPDPRLFNIYGPTKLVHNANDQSKIRKAVQDSGAEAMANADTGSVIRTRDAAGAELLTTALLADESDHYDTTDAPKEVPGARCVRLNSKGDSETEYKNRCYVTYKRYIGVVSSDDESDVRQRVAAQYALFANSL